MLHFSLLTICPLKYLKLPNSSRPDAASQVFTQRPDSIAYPSEPHKHFSHETLPEVFIAVGAMKHSDQ